MLQKAGKHTVHANAGPWLFTSMNRAFAEERSEGR
ncbi:hypothetical protein BH20GEM3_BH20GEM3_06260 [soil metagenome]|jgi:hypothetical protein